MAPVTLADELVREYYNAPELIGSLMEQQGFHIELAGRVVMQLRDNLVISAAYNSGWGD